MKPTTAQLWLIHSLEVFAGGGVLTAVLTVYAAFHAGNFDLASAGVAAGGALVAFLANGYKGIVNNAQTGQAIADSISDLTASHNGLLQQFGHLSGLVTSLMHVTISQGAAANPPTATVPASAATQPAPVQITPNPAFNATTSINPFAQSSLPPQQAFAAPATSFPWTQTMQAVQSPQPPRG